jgi:hypothetical protein
MSTAQGESKASAVTVASVMIVTMVAIAMTVTDDSPQTEIQIGAGFFWPHVFCARRFLLNAAALCTKPV